MLREYARWHCRRVAIAGHVINLTLTRIGNTLASMEKRPFPVYRQFGDVGGYSVCRCSTQPNALRPRFEIFTEAVVFALAWLENNKKDFERPWCVAGRGVSPTESTEDSTG